MEDAKILELFLGRDDKAITAVSEKYGKGLTRLSENMLKSREDAEECVNDTYLAAWKSIPPKMPNPIFAYLARICRNISLNRLKFIHSKKRNAGICVIYDELEQCIANPDNERRLESKEIADAVTAFLNSETEKTQKIFVCRYFYSESIKDIARELKMSESSVKTQLFRIRIRLRDYLEKEEIYI